MLAEAGGGALRFDGGEYGPAQPIDAGIIGASSRPSLAEVHAAVSALGLPHLDSSDD